MEQNDKTYDDLIKSLEAEQPSMRFTKNVMDALEGMEVARVSKRYVNPLVVRSIAFVLIMCMIAALYIVFTSATTLPAYISKLPHIKQPENLNLYIIGINVVLLLVLAERWLSSKNKLRQLNRPQ